MNIYICMFNWIHYNYQSINSLACFSAAVNGIHGM